MGIDVEDHVPSFAPVATGRPAEGDIFLAPESDAAVAAVPGFDLDDGLVNKHQGFLSRSLRAGCISNYNISALLFKEEEDAAGSGGAVTTRDSLAGSSDGDDGTYDNDRPPIVGTVGRESGQVRLRGVPHTDRETLVRHVHPFTLAEAVVFTDEWQSYAHIVRTHATVCHSEK
ncbi:MAG TPA: hypothetical protein EYH27_05970, partial [Anaerolineales bacterium]|nr:hypothetical protein [Anaerolineales bacterium]